MFRSVSKSNKKMEMCLDLLLCYLLTYGLGLNLVLDLIDMFSSQLCY